MKFRLEQCFFCKYFQMKIQKKYLQIFYVIFGTVTLIGVNNFTVYGVHFRLKFLFFEVEVYIFGFK